MVKINVLALSMLVMCVTATAQVRRTIDSLIKALPAMKDSTRARSLNKISLYFANTSADTALIYANQGLELVRRMNWQRGIGTFYNCIGNALASKGSYDSSSYYYSQTLLINKEMNDTTNMASSYNNLGANDIAKGDYVRAIENFTIAYKLGEAIGSNYYSGMGAENIGNTYYQQANYEEAIDWGRKSLTYRLADEDIELIPSSHLLLGMSYRELKSYDSAFKYLGLALEQERSNGNMMKEATALSNIANTYYYQNDYRTALEWSLQADSVWNVFSPNFESALENAGLLGNCYLELYKMEKLRNIDHKFYLLQAKKILSRAISQGILQKNKSIYGAQLRSLAEVSSFLGDNKNAYTYYKMYDELQDSIYSQENKNRIAATISQLEIEKKDNELKLKNATIEIQRKQRIVFMTGLAALAIIGGLLFYQSKARKRNNLALMKLNNELAEANKVKAKFFGIISHDFRTPVANLVNYLHLQKNAPDLLTTESKQIQEQKIRQSAENLLETMETMLLWSKQQMQQFKPSLGSISVVQLFDYLRQFFGNLPEVEIQFDSPPEMKVSSDENYLKAIMQNLTSNAIKALRNTPHPLIRWEAYTQNGHSHLSITDNGPGMSAQQMNALFSDEVVANTKTGFGFHIVRDLAKAINCTITIEQTKEKGTKFILTLSDN